MGNATNYLTDAWWVQPGHPGFAVRSVGHRQELIARCSSREDAARIVAEHAACQLVPLGRLHHLGRLLAALSDALHRRETTVLADSIALLEILPLARALFGKEKSHAGPAAR